MEMNSKRPYLLRAFYDWIVDNQCTPVLVANPSHPRCKIPFDCQYEQEIVFNISPTAIRDLDISDDAIQFRASFNGIVHVSFIPVAAVLALYADENNEGIFFDDAEDDSIQKEIEPPSVAAIDNDTFADQTAAKGKPFLRIVE